jgi:hypothetical protein
VVSFDVDFDFNNSNFNLRRKTMKNSMSVLITTLTLTLILTAGSATAQTSWNIGVGADSAMVTATLTGATLTIEGTGDMRDYFNFPFFSNYTPWFSFRDQIDSVIIRNGVTSIGDYAFDGLGNLATLIIPPNSVTSIGTNAFAGTRSLTSVVIPHSVTSIGNNAFSGSGLLYVTIGNGLTTYPSSAFNGCDGLLSIDVSPANTHLSSVDGILFDKAQTTLVRYPQGRPDSSYTIPAGITTIGGSAFSDAVGLTSVIIPNNVTAIGSMAFWGCTGLTSIIIPESVTRIESLVFNGSTNLSRVDFLRREPMESMSWIENWIDGDTLAVFDRTSPSLLVYGFNENTTVKDYPRITFVPYHGISLSQPGAHAFGSVQYGDTPPPLTVTLTNTNYPLAGGVSVTLSNGDTSAFTIGQSAISNLALGDSAVFTVTPRLGLGAGEHTAAVTASIAPGAGNEDNWITPQSFNVSVTVAPRPITIIAMAANKEYDGTMATGIRGEVIIDGKIGDDDVTVVGGTALFADANIGVGKPIVSFSGFSLSGAAAGNYVLSSQPSSAGVTANISPRVITITGVTAAGRDPDGTTAVALTGGTLAGVVAGDNVGFTLGSGTAASAEAGIHPVTVNIVLTGPDAPNYTLSPPEITVNIGGVSIAVIDREIPAFVNPDEAAIITPVNPLSSLLTAGPNPAGRSSGRINFFWQGGRIDDAVLTIFDAFGNIVNKIRISDCRDVACNALTESAQPNRVIGTWDLTDTRGRAVPEGTYLLRGTVITANGNRERVSVMVGVR